MSVFVTFKITKDPRGAWSDVLISANLGVAVRRAIKQRVSVYNGEEKMKRKASKRMTNRLGLRAIFIDDASPINIQMVSQHLASMCIGSTYPSKSWLII